MVVINLLLYELYIFVINPFKNLQSLNDFTFESSLCSISLLCCYISLYKKQKYLRKYHEVLKMNNDKIRDINLLFRNE